MREAYGHENNSVKSWINSATLVSIVAQIELDARELTSYHAKRHLEFRCHAPVSSRPVKKIPKKMTGKQP
jgi:hypothetical protein